VKDAIGCDKMHVGCLTTSPKFRTAICKGTVHNKQVEILIHTGSACNLINSKVASTRLIPTEIRLVDASGTQIKCLGIDEISLTLGNFSTKLDSVCVQNINFDVVIRSRFCQNSKPKFRSQTIKKLQFPDNTFVPFEIKNT